MVVSAVKSAMKMVDFSRKVQLKYVCMYVCMYVSGQTAQVVEHQTADPWVAGSSLTSGEKCKNC